MPTYQYSCTDCGHFFEQVQSFSEDSLTVCPQCQGRLRKVFNAVGVVFKGSGFYRTDSRTDGRKSERAGEGGETTGGGSGSGEPKSGEKKSGQKAGGAGTGAGQTGSGATAKAGAGSSAA